MINLGRSGNNNCSLLHLSIIRFANSCLLIYFPFLKKDKQLVYILNIRLSYIFFTTISIVFNISLAAARLPSEVTKYQVTLIRVRVDTLDIIKLRDIILTL